MLERVIIIGGGFAGLSAATALAEKGYHVTVLEGRQVLGGRAYSFIDKQTNDAVDNGQHLFMRCYRQTMAFLKRIGTANEMYFQRNLSVDFVRAPGQTATLRCWPLPAPFHLLSGLIRLKTLRWGDRFRMRHIQRALRQAALHPDILDDITVEQWLIRAHQSERARRYFWDLIAIATLNEDPRIASASSFVTVLAQAFFGKRADSQLGFAKVGLSDLYAHAAKDYIEARGGEVRLKSPVQSIWIENKQVLGVELREGTQLKADWVISAVPAAALLKMLPETEVNLQPTFKRLKELKPAPIVSIHLWFDQPITKSMFVGLLDTHVQWVFNKSQILSSKTKDGYISAVISGAHAFDDWPEDKILGLTIAELRRAFPKVSKATLVRYLVIKEHQATLSPSVGTEALRAAYQSPYDKLLLAGDWTKTGLPATIESACVSGHACAEIISRHCEEQSDVATQAVKPKFATPAKQPAGSR